MRRDFLASERQVDIQEEAQPKKSIMMPVILGLVVGISVFLAITRSRAETSFETPPTGVIAFVSDDFEHGQSEIAWGDLNSDEKLIWTDDNDDDIVFQTITRERFLRYTQPPFLRYACFTGDDIACSWAHIDIQNFDDREEWIDFLSRFMIGIASGLVTSFMIWILQRARQHFHQ